jgi:hypothetical protein
MKITDALLAAFLRCKYKAHLKTKELAGDVCGYEAATDQGWMWPTNKRRSAWRQDLNQLARQAFRRLLEQLGQRPTPLTRR